LPVVAIVERNVNRALCGGKEHSAAHRIFAHGIHVFIRGNAIDGFSPGLAGVARAQNVRAQIVETKRVNGGVGCLRVKVAGLDDLDLLECRHIRRRDFIPLLAAIKREMDAAIVGAGPNTVDIER